MGFELAKWFGARRAKPHDVAEIDHGSVQLTPDLARFVGAVSTVSDVDDPDYRNAVEALHAEPAVHVREIARVLDDLGDEGHALRQCLLMAAAELPVAESVELLRRHALRAQRARPARRSNASDVPCVAARDLTADEALRVQSVEGLEQLARAGVPTAIDALAECAAHGSLTVRARSLAALGEFDEAGDVRADVVARLATDERYLAELRRVDVRDVAQVTDPRRHLTRDERDDRGVPDIDASEPWPTSGRATPRAGRTGGHG